MRLIFGTSTLHWLSNKSRHNVIIAALNNGFSQFDTSGVYGLGATNKYLGSLGLPKNICYSAKLGLKTSRTIGFSRVEVFSRKLFFPKKSKIMQDNCYSNWQQQFETQMSDLGVSKVQRLLLHERFINIELWQLFQKFINEYSDHFDEYGVSASWLTLRPIINKIYDENLLIQTTPDVIYDKIINNLKNITLYGISNICHENKNVLYKKKNINGVIYFSSKVSRIKNFVAENKFNR